MSGGASLGMSQSKRDASSSSNAYGYNSSESQDNAASGSVSSSNGTSNSSSSIAFQDLYSQLFGDAMSAGGRSVALAPELTSASRSLFSGGTDFLSSLSSNEGSDYLTSRLNDDSVLDKQLLQLKDESGKLFSDVINPAITSDAVAGGTLGGGRQGVAQGIGAGEVQRQYTSGATQLITANQQAKDAAAAQVMNGSINAASTGLGALPGLLDVMERGNNAELGTYSAVSGILGGPTVLSRSESSESSNSIAQSISEAFSRSFGEQTSKSTSKDRGRAWSFDTAVSA